MLTCFYDIESFDNAFTLCNFIPHENTVDLYYLVDTDALISEPDFLKKLTDKIYEQNKNFSGQVRCFNLKDKTSADRMAMTFGLSTAYLVNDPDSKSKYPDAFRPVCDTDPDYDENKHPYLMGYNSYNYDTTMLALYFMETYPITNSDVRFQPPTAYLMRQYNNSLFLPQFKGNMPSRLEYSLNPKTKQWDKIGRKNSLAAQIRRSMIMSGRHIDVARLNEKQQHVGLKRLIGMMGGQILESDKLSHNQSHIDNAEQFYDLIAYNVSDCVNLKAYVFDDRKSIYHGQFNLKRGLLHTYPELIYSKLPDKYAPDIRPQAVRQDRLCIDSSSAQFATKALCPYNHLKDIPVVSFMYPSELKAKELGIQQVNVLEETRKFFYANFPQPELRAEFDRIYYYYKAIEGKNFNDSQNYQDDYTNLDGPIPKYPELVSNIRDYSKSNTCLYYYNADGTPTSCFVTFSIGGIHGAEYNKELFEADKKAFEELEDLYNQVKTIFPDPLGLKLAKTVTLTLPDGTQQEFKATQFLKSGSTKKKAEYKDIEKLRPALFQENSKGAWELNKKYVYTSSDLTNHEDFTSYYPNLLRMLSAFHNTGLGYDRYAEIFEQKQSLGKKMKDKSLPEEERKMASVQREGTKLVLNSASGAADAAFESNIRMNNIIISMRIIGQLFSYRIGQAQALKGARVTSTNTDGLFTVLEATLNNAILEQESAIINVEIEPEPTYLISKDSNNRIEVDADTGKIQRASGGSLACHKGPTPDKSLAHPAIIDWALCEYLVYNAMRPGGNLSDPFNETMGRNILKAAPKSFDKTMLLNMYQNIISSSLGTDAYNFAIKPGKTDNPIPLQHYNRVFIMKDGTPKTHHLYCAAARKITDATASKRRKKGDQAQQHDPTAMRILNANGLPPTQIPADKEAVVKKITGIEPTWYMLIMNRALCDLTEQEQDDILNNLDYEKYLGLLRAAYENNWRNTLPGAENDPAPDDSDGDTIIVAEDDTAACAPAPTNNTAPTNAPVTDTVTSVFTNETEPPCIIGDEPPMAPIPTDIQTAPQPVISANDSPATSNTDEAQSADPIPESEPVAEDDGPFVVRTLEPETTADIGQTQASQTNNPTPANAPVTVTSPNRTQTTQTAPKMPNTGLPPLPLSGEPIPKPVLNEWLHQYSPWYGDSPFPVTELDSCDPNELMQLAMQRMREAYALMARAYELMN